MNNTIVKGYFNLQHQKLIIHIIYHKKGICKSTNQKSTGYEKIIRKTDQSFRKPINELSRD